MPDYATQTCPLLIGMWVLVGGFELSVHVCAVRASNFALYQSSRIRNETHLYGIFPKLSALELEKGVGGIFSGIQKVFP